jgi:hypothetical protein
VETGERPVSGESATTTAFAEAPLFDLALAGTWYAFFRWRATTLWNRLEKNA